MARHESDREDLMREATALRQRMELSVSGEGVHVIAGFRSNDYFSLFFGEETALHFDDAGLLRRAYFRGNLYRSQQHTLARLTRGRTATETRLLRHDLSSQELTDFRAAIRERLARLEAALRNHDTLLIAQVPPEGDLRPRLQQMLEVIVVAGIPLSPPLRG